MIRGHLQTESECDPVKEGEASKRPVIEEEPFSDVDQVTPSQLRRVRTQAYLVGELKQEYIRVYRKPNIHSNHWRFSFDRK